MSKVPDAFPKYPARPNLAVNFDTATEADIDAVEAAFKAYDNEVSAVRRRHFEISKEWADLFTSRGAVVRPKSGGGNLKWFDNLMESMGFEVRTTSQNWLHNNQWYSGDLRRCISDYRYKKQMEERASKEQDVWFKIGAAAGTPYLGGDIAAYIKTVRAAHVEAARAAWYEENPEGTEVYIKFCDECSAWEVGQYRCSCGNRRVYLDYDVGHDGDVWFYPAPH